MQISSTGQRNKEKNSQKAKKKEGGKISKEEFLKAINAAGLSGRVFVKPTNYAGGPYCLGCFEKDGEWIVYENDERGKHEDLLKTPSGEEAFQYLYEYMIGKF